MRLTIDLDAAAAAFYTRVADSARLPLGPLWQTPCSAGGRAFPRSAPQAGGGGRPVPGYHDSGTGHFFHLLRRFFAVFVPLPDILLLFSTAECYNIPGSQKYGGIPMKSIRDIYKIGRGPSSSHTMGPERAARLFLSKYPDAEPYRVVLYGSLSKTGRGHGTDRVLYEVLGRERTEIVFFQGGPRRHPTPQDHGLLRLSGPRPRPHHGSNPWVAATSASWGGCVPSAGDLRENSFAESGLLQMALHQYPQQYVEMNEGGNLGLPRESGRRCSSPSQTACPPPAFCPAAWTWAKGQAAL